MNKNLFFISCFLFCFGLGFAQEKIVLTPRDIPMNKPFKYFQTHETPAEFKVLEIADGKNRFKSELYDGATLELLDGEGQVKSYILRRGNVLSAELRAKYPQIESFNGFDQNGRKVFTLSKGRNGVHIMGFDDQGRQFFIDPLEEGLFIQYLKTDLPGGSSYFECKTEELIGKNSIKASAQNLNQSALKFESDVQLRTYRFAVAATGEYSSFHLNDQSVPVISTESEKKAAVLSAIQTTVARVNFLLERDISVHLELVANNDEIIFLDADQDGFSNFDAGSLIDESQVVIDDIIGNENYDLGHTFSTGGGGLAYLNSTCDTDYKAKGITGSSNPIGDSFDVDYVAHEIGHQFGATHTFNGFLGSCGGNISLATSVEPGSGSTIMSYAGLCSGQNIQTLVDSYYHQISIQQMLENIQSGSGSSCGTQVMIENSPPVITEFPTAVIIPKSTPFLLDAKASDADGDMLTYAWEQMDKEQVEAPPESDLNSGPVFRSVMPDEDSKRYFPKLSTVLQGGLANTWEVLPSVGRYLNFGLIVRDQNPLGGQVVQDEVEVHVSADAGPFKITTNNEYLEYHGGEVVELQWDVAGTDLAPVNTNLLSLYLSIDGGENFDLLIDDAIHNDGSFEFVMPFVAAADCRLMLKANDNIFFDINDASFGVVETDFALINQNLSTSICSEDELVFDFEYRSNPDFQGDVSLSVRGYESVEITPQIVNQDGQMVQVKLSGLSALDSGVQALVLRGSSSTATHDFDFGFSKLSSQSSDPVLSFPENFQERVALNVDFHWENDEFADAYIFELSKSQDFADLLVQAETIATHLEVADLEANTRYYWRVKSLNDCGVSGGNSSFTFETGDFLELDLTYTGGNVSIPDNDPIGAEISLEIESPLIVKDIEVSLSIDHTWVGDLSIILKSPTGEEVLLKAQDDIQGVNMESTVFADDAEVAISAGSAPYNGRYRPSESFSKFLDVYAKGIWTLRVSDNVAQDAGVIKGFGLKLTGETAEDLDGDGIPNDLDNCPGSFNPDQNDSDGDGIGDVCDSDWDNDGVPNTEDNCPEIPNPDQADYDLDGIGDGCDMDIDGDGVLNQEDNCPMVYNPDQLDFDQDGIGDTCDDEVDMNIDIPNGLSPNGDGLNDNLDLTNWSMIYPNLTLRVFNSSGVLLYEQENYINQWHGQGNVNSSAKLAVGSYYFEISSGLPISLDYPANIYRDGWIYLNY